MENSTVKSSIWKLDISSWRESCSPSVVIVVGRQSTADLMGPSSLGILQVGSNVSLKALHYVSLKNQLLVGLLL